MGLPPSPLLLTTAQAPLKGPTMFCILALLFSPALTFAQDPYQTDLVDQYRIDPYQAAGSYQEGPYQEPYKVPTHYQTKKKQYQLESYQEPYVEEEDVVPKPFAYQYGGVDAQGLESSKIENQGDDGVVRGEYRVQLPDGRTQIVSYTSDHENGYQAEVRYEGEARPEVVEPNDYLGPEGQVRVRQYPKHTKQPYGRY